MGLLSAPLTAGRKASAGLMGFVDDVFHGSTHNIDDFSKAGTLNPEGHFGAGHYFTSSADDASEHYAGLGPDLTSRIEQRMDAIDSELDGYEIDDLLNAFPQMTKKEAKSISFGNSEVFDDFKRRVATKELAGDNSGAVYPIKLRSNKTYDLGTKEDTFMKYERDLPNRDDLADEIRDELDINDYDDKGDFDDAVEDLVDERYYDAMNYEEPQGELADFMLSLSNQADEYGFDASDLMSSINEAAMDSDGLTALELDDIMRTTEWYADNDQGKLINNEVYRKAIEDSGFDTIKHKGNIFKGMEVDDDTVHTIVFNPSNIRSVNARFDPAKSNSSNILASNPVATTGAGILGLAAMAGSDDADAGVAGKSLASITKAAEKQGVKLDVFESKKGLELSKIVVPEKSKGVGTSIMNDLADYADQTGQTVSLSPSTDFGGTSKKRLSEFYKRFGFVQNKGKNKDFTISNSMYRSPSSVAKAVAPVGTGLLGLGAAAQSNDTYADYSPSNLARLQSSDVGSIEAPQSMAASNIAGLMGSVNKVGYDDPLLGMVASQLPSELMNKIAYNDRRGLLDYAKAYAGLLGF